MKATTKKTAKSTKATKSKKEEPTKVSKTWLAVLANVGTGEILDMRAVLK
jgi:hypothetical protein